MSILHMTTSFWVLAALVSLALLALNVFVFRNGPLSRLPHSIGVYRAANTLIIFIIIASGLMGINTLDDAVAEAMIVYKEVNTQSGDGESITTYTFEQGKIIGRVSLFAMEMGPAHTLRGRLDGFIDNLRDSPLVIRGLRAISLSNRKTIKDFDFNYERATLAPGARSEFSVSARITPGLLHIVRNYDLGLRLLTDAGAIDLPLQIYSLDVEAAVDAGLLRTNIVHVQDSQGIINFLNCAQYSDEGLCGGFLEQMGVVKP